MMNNSGIWKAVLKGFFTEGEFAADKIIRYVNLGLPAE